jgi:hypothetical protein
MRVVFIENTTPVLVAARTLAAQATNECFSLREVAEKTKASLEETRVALDTLLEADWSFRVDTDKPSSPVLSPDERLGLRRHSLTVGREYEVLGIEADYYRVLNDPETWPYGNDPVLFHPSGFRLLDAKEPSFWVCQIGEEGERYCYPPEWSEPGFFEDYHDRVEVVRQRFWDDLRHYYPKTWQERKGAT